VKRAALLAAALAPLALLPLLGCRVERADSKPRWNESRPTRLALFAGVEKLAVAPFRDPGKSEGLDAEKFANLVANELLRVKRFRVVYPRGVIAAAREANREMSLRSGGKTSEDEIIRLERSELDAVHAARAAGADAVLVGRVHDFDVYPPKRLAVTFRVYLCAAPRRSFADIVRMSDAGVPLEIGGELREKFIWERQWHYDTSRKGERMGMTWHARKHEKTRGFGDEIFYYSTNKFLAYVSSEVSGRLYADSLWYRSGSGRRLARAHGIDYNNLGPAGNGGSGYRPDRADDGVAPGGRSGGARRGSVYGPTNSSHGLERR
jgi:hypothetical protein